MKNELKTTIRVGVVTGLVLLAVHLPLFFMEVFQSSPFLLIGFVTLFPVTGFIAGRQATDHPVWASIISALVASLGILFLGIITNDIVPDGALKVEGSERILLLLMAAKFMIKIWIQLTVILTGLSAAGGALALFLKRRKKNVQPSV